MKYPLFPVAELPPGSIRGATVDDTLRVAVVHTDDGRLYAVRDRCPHMGAPLSQGVLHPVVEGSDVGEWRLEQRPMLRCSWHGLEFDLESGSCLADERRRVRTYAVRVEDGQVVLEHGSET